MTVNEVFQLMRKKTEVFCSKIMYSIISPEWNKEKLSQD